MGRAVNMLYHVERRQQVNEAANVWVVIVLSSQVEIPANHDGTRVDDQRLKHVRQLTHRITHRTRPHQNGSASRVCGQ